MKPADYITAADLARKWGCSPQWIAQLVRDGRIKSKLLFGRRLIRADVKRPEAMRSGPKPKS